MAASDNIARQPRAIVAINGSTFAGWISWEVTSNSDYEADHFRVSFAASGLPTATVQPFIEQKELFIEIFAGFPSNPAAPTAAELDSLIYGRVDSIEFDPVYGLLTFTGRDLTAVFIDAKVDADYQNQTASQIASALASRHTLVPVVTATTALVGTYYKREQTRMNANQSEWDLLAWLAREEGFQCFVKGQELHFAPPPDATATPYQIKWNGATAASASPNVNAQELTFSRALTVTKGVTVTVRSPSTTKKVPVVQSYPGSPKVVQAGKSSPFGNTQSYFFTVAANRTPVQCAQEAIRRYREIVAHEMRMQARMPGDNLLSTANILRVVGTGTAFDQDYYPQEITRTMSLDEGYTMAVTAKNHSPGLAQ